MSWKLRLKRGTLADVSTAAANSSLDQWSPIIISNENRLIVAKSPSEYFDVGTVRSVGISVPPGFSVNNTPITTSGTISINYSAGYQGYTTDEASKLSTIAPYAQANVPTNLAEGTRTSTSVSITSSTGSSASLSAATTSLAGVMSAADKTKLDGISGGGGIPEGGDEGQLLVKSSEDDYDTEWKSPNPVAVKVYKADNKALNVVTTEDGHYVKVTKADGVTELTVSVTNNGVSPPITTQGPIPRYLAEDPLPVSNIGPIWHDGYASMMTWRTIGSYTGYASLEVGKIAHFDISSVPPGYVASNADISGSAFEALRAAIGQSTTRDARGVVIRGLDNGRGLDPGRTHGTYQADGIRESNLWVRALTGNNSIINPAPDGEFTRQTYTGTTSQGSSLVSNTPLPTKVTLGSATETRMKNLALLSFWKF